jgi:hypothetical protein
MTRNARTTQFRKEIQKQYCLNLIEHYEKGISYFIINKLIYDNFGHLYDNEDLVEELVKRGLIEWGKGHINMIYSAKGLSTNPNLELSWIDKYPMKEWDFSYISKHPNFKITWIEKMPMKEWCWTELSLHPNFKIEWMDMFPDKDWNWFALYNRKSFKIEWFEKYPEKDIYFKYLQNHSFENTFIK